MKLKSWLITLVAGAIMIMLFLPKNTDKPASDFDTINQIGEEERPRYYSKELEMMPRTNNIWWEIEDDKMLPKTAQAVGLVWNFVDLEPLRKLITEEGLKYEQEKSREMKAEVWTNEAKTTTAIYQPQTRKLEWATNVETREDLGSGNLPTQEEAEERIKEVIRNMSSTKTINEMETVEISPKKLVYPRWVTTEKETADAWEVGMNFKYGTGEIIRSGGYTIEATIGRGGKILKLKTVWPLVIEESQKSILNLKTIEEVKQEASKVKVWKVKGGEESDLSYETMLGNIGVNSIELVYWWESGERWLMPYYLLSGNGIASGEPVGVEMVLPAGKLER